MHRISADQLFERHHLAIYRFLLRTTGEPATAEDLTQEVFLRAVRSAPGEGGDAGSRAWLYRVARNLLADRARRARRRPRPSPLEPAESRAGVPAEGLRLELATALATLAREDREIFLMSQVGGLSYREIASIAGVSEAGIRSRIFRARCRLREALAPAPARRVKGEER